jgi:hypothetical protein
LLLPRGEAAFFAVERLLAAFAVRFGAARLAPVARLAVARFFGAARFVVFFAAAVVRFAAVFLAGFLATFAALPAAGFFAVLVTFLAGFFAVFFAAIWNPPVGRLTLRGAELARLRQQMLQDIYCHAW